MTNFCLLLLFATLADDGAKLSALDDTCAYNNYVLITVTN